MTASYIFLFSAMTAVAMLAAFCTLLFRRWRQEGRKEIEREMFASITRSYLRRVAGQLDEEMSPKWSNESKLSAVSHIHLLLRGGERNRLMQMAELDGLLETTLRRSRSWRAARRVDAIRMLQQFGSEACIARLRELFTQDRDDTVRLEAAFALAAIYSLPPPRETIRILGMFDRTTNRLDRALLRASAPHYTEQLVLLLNDQIPHEKRALIVDALGWSDDALVLPILERASRHDNAELRSSALRAAARLGHPSAEEWVIRLLNDPVNIVRIQAVNCCTSLGLTNAVPLLKQRLDDDELWVRLRAEHALDVLEHQWANDEAKGLLG